MYRGTDNLRFTASTITECRGGDADRWDRKMKKEHKPIALKNAPMDYAPANELGVVFLFAHVARRLGFRIETIRPQFPDCIAYRRIGDVEKSVRIEFEFRSGSFKAHGHDPKHCDIIIYWHHDWPDSPAHIEVIELKKFFGVSRKVWIIQAIKGFQEQLDKFDRFDWSMSKQVTPGDLLLMYRCAPVSAVSDIFLFEGSEKNRGPAGWRDGEAYFGAIRRVCHFASPVFLTDMRNHRILKTASFVRRNMQGIGLQATEYWPYLYQMFLDRNPKKMKELARFRPDRL